MDVLQQEIVKLLADGSVSAGDIRNRLNGSPVGWDVSQVDVAKALRGLEDGQFVECVWRITPNEI